MVYQGEAHITPFSNKGCTRPLQLVDGNYILEMDVITNNFRNPYRFNIWLKNEGSHSAYDVKIVQTTSIPNVVLPSVIPEVFSGQVIGIPIEVTIPQFSSNEINFGFTVEYDNI